MNQVIRARQQGELWHKAFSIVMELILNSEKKQIIVHEPLYKMVKVILEDMDDRVIFPDPFAKQEGFMCKCGHSSLLHSLNDRRGCTADVPSVSFWDKECGCSKFRDEREIICENCGKDEKLKFKHVRKDGHLGAVYWCDKASR